MIDLRSDTVTLPTYDMYQAMQMASLGDDVYDGDPTTKALESVAADLLGQKVALFCSSGTQANLLAILSHCARGDEFISGEIYHASKFEGGGAAALAGVSSHPVAVEIDGSLALESISSAIKPDDIHFPKTTLLCLENTVSGRPLDVDYLHSMVDLASASRIKTHLDGARLLNAAVHFDCEPRDFGSLFDSVTLCLSKGLSAPVGSILAGSREFIDRAKRWRKTLGGGLRQSGVLAACGIVALKEYEQRLRSDHESASLLAARLKDIAEVKVEYGGAQTNMVHISLDEQHHAPLKAFLRSKGVLINGRLPQFRLVTHRHISGKHVDAVAGYIEEYFTKTRSNNS